MSSTLGSPGSCECRPRPTWTRSLSSFTLLSSFCFSTTMADTVPSPSCCTQNQNFHSLVSRLREAGSFQLHLKGSVCRIQSFTSMLLAVARIFCSSFRFREMIMAMLTGSSWNRSWRESESTFRVYHQIELNITRRVKSRGPTCRFLLILRMLCCSRKLFSRAKRLCWSSS